MLNQMKIDVEKEILANGFDRQQIGLLVALNDGRTASFSYSDIVCSAIANEGVGAINADLEAIVRILVIIDAKDDTARIS